MPSLSDLLGDEMSSLNRFADRMRNSIEDYWRTEHAGRPLYSIKHRVKTASSIREKLKKLAESSPDASRRDRAKTLLQSEGDDVTLELLFATIEDVVGIRAIFLFRHDKKCFFESLKDPAALSKWFRILRKEDGELNIDEYVPVEDFLAFGKSNPAMRTKESGYTSSHAIIGFSNDDGRVGLHGKFKCELQIRTVIEEAWGELTHYLSYKKAKANEVGVPLKIAKKHLDGVEESLGTLHSEAARSAQAGQWDPRIQLWKLHERRFPRSLAGDALDRFNDAREFYRQYDFATALEKFESLRASIRRSHGEIPPQHRVWLERHVEYNIALTRLCLNESTDISKARQSLSHLRTSAKVLAPETTEPLVSLRLAHIAELSKDYQLAHAMCDEALQMLDASPNQALERVGFFSVDSLRADIMAYWGTIYFRQVEEIVRRELSLKKSSSPAGRSKRLPGEWTATYRKAVETTKAALDVASAAGDRIVVERCVNNLLYYALQIGDCKEAQIWRSKLNPEQDCNPLILDTLGWFEFKCNHDCDAALNYIKKALSIVRERAEVAPFLSRVQQSIERHQKLVSRYKKSSEKYRLGEEYTLNS